MAKKRKKEKAPEEDYQFVPPEFDERKFLEKEIRDTKTVVFTVIYGVLFGIVAGLISYASTALIGLAFVLGIAGLFSLKYIYPLVKIDIAEFKKKNWAGSVAWFFLTFLAIWVLMFNVPFADFAKPDIANVIVWVETPTNITGMEYKYLKTEGDYVWVPLYGESLADMVRSRADYTINLSARVSDNSKLSSVTISVIGVTSGAVPMTDEGSNRYGYSINGTDLAGISQLTFSITAVDAKGHTEDFMPARTIPVSS